MDYEIYEKNIFKKIVILVLVFILLFILLSLYRISTSISSAREDNILRDRIYEKSLSEYYRIFDSMFCDDCSTIKRDIDIEKLKYIKRRLNKIKLINNVGYLDSDLLFIANILSDKADTIIRDYEENGTFTDKNYEDYYELRQYINAVCESLK